MNLSLIRQACINLGLVEPISVEPDGTVWTGVDPDRVYADMVPILAEAERLQADTADRKQEILNRLGLTVEEVKLLLS